MVYGSEGELCSRGLAEGGPMCTQRAMEEMPGKGAQPCRWGAQRAVTPEQGSGQSTQPKA